MGNAWATFPLPEMSTLVLTMVILPMVMSMWFYSTHMMSWALSTALVLTWVVAISWCFNVQNPFVSCPWGTGPINALMCSESIYIFGVLTIMCLAAALVGSFVCWVLDVADIIPFSAIFPLSQREATNVSVPRANTRMGEAKQFLSVKTVSLKRWGLTQIAPPYAHVIFTAVMFAFTVMGPQIIYSIFMDDTGNNNQNALGGIIGIPVVGYIVTFIIWWFFPSVYVWGPCERNYKQLGAQYPWRESDDPRDIGTELEIYKKAMRDKDTSEAHMRIGKAVLVIGIFHVASNIILGTLRYLDIYVNANWVTATVLVGVILIIAIITALVLWAMRKPESGNVYMKQVPVPVLDENGNPVDQSQQAPVPEEANQSDATSVAVDESGGTSSMFSNTLNAMSQHQHLSRRLHATGVLDTTR